MKLHSEVHESTGRIIIKNSGNEPVALIPRQHLESQQQFAKLIVNAPMLLELVNISLEILNSVTNGYPVDGQHNVAGETMNSTELHDHFTKTLLEIDL